MTTLSILVPTYRRHDFLRVCLDSIVASGLSPLEVIVGDNGNDVGTAAVIAEFKSFLPLTHLCNPPGLQYIDNVEILVNAARGDWLCMMHDDDFFCADTSQRLIPILQQDNIDLIFGDHWHASEAGEILPVESDHATQTYQRHLLHEGILTDPVPAALKKSICPKGFLLRTKIAQRIPLDKYFKSHAVERWLMEILLQGACVYYTSKRFFVDRLRDFEGPRLDTEYDLVVRSLCTLNFQDPQHKALLQECLRELVPNALTWWLIKGEREEAEKWLFSDYYPPPSDGRALVKRWMHLVNLYLPSRVSHTLLKNFTPVGRDYQYLKRTSRAPTVEPPAISYTAGKI
jgi:glycosyltransferase involved in cell wall biosynthesis